VNLRKLGLLAGVVVVLLSGAYFVVRAESRPSAGHELQTAWTALLATNLIVPTAADLTRSRYGLSTFAATIGRIRFPAADEGTAHAVIRDAVALATDTSTATIVPARRASPAGTCPLVTGTSALFGGGTAPCLAVPAYPASKATANYPSSYGSDVAAFNQDVPVLFAELGLKPPS
jgi:hypothetical protein